MTPQKKTALTLFSVTLVMLSLSFAAVPFYRLFCQLTGFAGTPAISDVGADEVLERTVIAGQASYNVVPDQAGGYFTKIECFCFTEQVLQPHERVVMPVSFFVDPSIVDDAEASQIHEITLSYTFHEIPQPQKQAALAASPVPPIN